MTERISGTAAATIRWHEWGAAAFAEAKAADKPILLAITASWCEQCAAMDRSSYARPDVAAFVSDRFVPIRLDSDRRPDLNERYNLGGWPTTAFLTPDGEILGGGTYIAPDRMLAVLNQVTDAFRTRRAEILARSDERHAQRVAGPARRSMAAPDPAAIGGLHGRLLEAFDQEHGGFGTEPKFTHTAALTLALELYRTSSDSRLRALLVTTLDKMSRLYDPVDGGFFRCAAARDWSRASTEKMLEENAALLRLYLDAGVVLGRETYRELAADIIRYVNGTLADQRDGGFFGSQAADAAYYQLDSSAARRARPAPPVDRSMYVDWNCEMIAAYLRAADVLDDVWLREFAVRSLERVVLAAYRPGIGLAHAADEEAAPVRGLLSDHVRAAAALIWAHAATGRLPYSMLAAELMYFAIRTMWDEDDGGFFDRALEPGIVEEGLLRERVKPFALNCEAARVLARLSIITGNDESHARAEATMASQTPEYRRQDLFGAPYGLALREVVERQPPLGLRLSAVDWRLNEPDED